MGRPSNVSAREGGASVRERFLLVGILPAAVLFMNRSVHDTFELPKFVLILAVAGVVGSLALVRIAGTGIVTIPRHRATWAASAFLGAFAIATVASDQPVLSLVGEYRRFQGLVSYLAYALIFALIMRSLAIRDIRRLCLLLIAAAAASGAYAIVQATGADPFEWGGRQGVAAFSTFGNPNFAAAGFGIALPVSLWGALFADLKARHRAAAGGAAMLVAAGIVATASIQGFVAGAAGIFVVLVAWFLERGGLWRRRGVPALGAWALLGAATVVASFTTGAGPLGFIGTQIGSVLRKFYWRTAVSMIAQNPITGVGPDRFRGHYPSHRPVETVQYLGFEISVDEAHSVPLTMFAEGGLFLGFTYLAFLVFVGVALIRGLQRLEGERRMLLAAVGGAWLAYQVQSLVSIDVPILALAHWAMAAAVLIVAAEAELITVPIPGLRSKDRSRGRAKAGMARRRALAKRAATVVAVVLLGGLAVALGAIWRADAALRDAFSAERAGASDVAAARADDVVSTVTWWPQYWYEASRIVGESRGDEAFREMLRRTVASDPRHIHGQVALARSYRDSDDVAKAWEIYDQVLEIDPFTPRYKAEYAESLAQNGRPGDAVPLLRAALELDSDPQYWLVLGRTYQELDRREDAMRAFEQVLANATGDTPAAVVEEAERKLAEYEG